MNYPKKDLDTTRSKILQLEQKQGKEAKQACKGVQDTLAAEEAKLAKHIAQKEKRIAEHRDDIDKYRKKKLAALAHLEEQWRVDKANAEAEAEANTAKATKAIEQIQENLDTYVKEHQGYIAQLKLTLPKITKVAYGTQSDAEEKSQEGDVIKPGVGYITSDDIGRQTFELALADNPEYLSLSG